jgi:dihydroxy-acid dehydratase
LISDEEWEARRAAWKPPPLRSAYGTLYKYINCVATASEGCVTDEKSVSDVPMAAPKSPAVLELEMEVARLKAELGK